MYVAVTTQPVPGYPAGYIVARARQFVYLGTLLGHIYSANPQLRGFIKVEHHVRG